MFFIRVILLPISFLYGLIAYLRNKFYDLGLFRSKSFEVPVISIGNITVGGTGKTPHVEYLIELLSKKIALSKLATLSRGYKRKTKGFLLANAKHNYLDIGDEPSQFVGKFKGLNVAVDEKRVRGVQKLMEMDTGVSCVVLDDAFQHRSIVPGLNILLVRYSDIGEKQFMLPSGYLREWRRGRKRADVIIITKSPAVFSPIEARRIKDVLAPEPYQHVFFSYIRYLTPKAFNEEANKLLRELELEDLMEQLPDFKVLFVSGIANASSLKHYLKDKSKELLESPYGDHHIYSMADVLRIIKQFEEIVSSKKLIITTEKDAMRLRDERIFPLLKSVPIFYIPIETRIHHDEEGFEKLIFDYVERNKRIC